jgi:hypothetical protein
VVGPSAQFEKTHRVSVGAEGVWTAIAQEAPVAHVKVTGVGYAPAGHPIPLTDKLVAMLLSKRTPTDDAVNVAVRVFGPSIGIVTEFAVPVAAPDHPLN